MGFLWSRSSDPATQNLANNRLAPDVGMMSLAQVRRPFPEWEVYRFALRPHATNLSQMNSPGSDFLLPNECCRRRCRKNGLSTSSAANRESAGGRNSH